MADDHPIDPSSPQPDDASAGGAGGSLDGLNESALNSLLDQASALAAELQTDLGRGERGSARNAQDEALGGTGDLPADLETQLDEVERLALEAGAELGVEPKIEPHAPPPRPSPPQDDAVTPSAETEALDYMGEATRPGEPGMAAHEDTDEAVPEFMSEFTRPEHAAKPANPAPPSPVVAPGMEDMPAGSPTGRAAARHSAPVAATQPRSPAAAPSSDPPMPGDDPAGLSTDPAPASARGLSDRSGNAAIGCVLIVARVLDLLDRPFVRMGRRTKHVLGLIGIATAATTLLVLASALL